MIRPARTARMAKTGVRVVSVAVPMMVIVIVVMVVRMIVHDLAYFR
ncbi:hypothetical protein EV657_102181 [Rhodovulum visakhapatnamense]|uniref:Uncharacterized protein n=1 Tax=Rhodovulum visakhapatnamense TaxID=364297 RepID=A0A4R8G997_9RHOB|nr:hypothetical protein EV657_102181 [Rhodovulum visakhapatnamense]